MDWLPFVDSKNSSAHNHGLSRYHSDVGETDFGASTY